MEAIHQLLKNHTKPLVLNHHFACYFFGNLHFLINELPNTGCYVLAFKTDSLQLLLKTRCVEKLEELIQIHRLV